jgi:hypothetical protein
VVQTQRVGTVHRLADENDTCGAVLLPDQDRISRCIVGLDERHRTNLLDYLVYLPINILPNAWRYIHISLSTKIIKIQEISASCRDLVKDIVSGKRCQLGGIAEYWAAVHQEKLTTQTSAGLN